MKKQLTTTLLAASFFASPSFAEFGYFESFEDNAIGWVPFNSTVNAVATGTNGINATDGSFYGVFGPGSTGSTGAFDTFGANTLTFGNGFTAGTDVYVDLSDADIAAGTYGFDLSIGINDNTGTHAQDNIFHVGAIDDGNGGYDVLVNASHNTDFALNAFKINTSPFGTTPETFSASGWYTFQVTFTPSATPDSVDILFEVIDESDSTLFSASTLSSPAQYTLSNVGGDRYAWMNYAETTNGLPVDSTFVTEVPEPGSLVLLGVAGLGVFARRRRR